MAVVEADLSGIVAEVSRLLHRGAIAGMEVLELRDGLERNIEKDERCGELVNPPGRHITEEFCRLKNVGDTLGNESHKARAGCVGGYWIVGKDDSVQPPAGSCQRSVALHTYNRVCNYKMNGDRGYEIDDARLDAAPMKEILWPAVFDARDHAEHILHAQRHSGPMVSLHFGHRHNEICFEHSTRQPKAFEAAIISPQTGLHNGITVEINEQKSILFKLLFKAACSKHQLGVALMARAFGDGDLSGSQTPKAFCCGNDETRVGVDFSVGDVVNQIGLKNNGPSGNIQAKQFQPYPK